MGLKNLVKRMMEDKNNIRYESVAESRRMPYHEWIADYERAHPAPETGEGEEAFLIFRNPSGTLAADAGKWIRRWFEEFPDALIVYGDEDVWSGDGERRSPCFKPDWSPDLLDTEFYPGSLVAVRKSWFRNQAKDVWGGGLELTGEKEQEEIAAYHRFVCHCVKMAGGYEKGKGRKTILHIPRILFHCGSEESRERWMRYADGESPRGKWGTGPDDMSSYRLSVVIPSRDNPELLEKCIRSVMKATRNMQYEIVVVDNGSTPQNRAQIEARLKDIRKSGARGLTLVLYHYEPMEFNFSRMCNLGARKASGNLLLFLNDDVELCEEGTTEALARMAARPCTGAVGLKLLYPDAERFKRIQHIGITNLPMGPVHKLQFCRDDGEYYMDWNRGRHNALAVTAACLMVEKEKFLEAGGFAEELAVAFNDVDLCFQLYRMGYENVCECGLYAWHHESYSRGDDETAEKLERLLAEREELYRRHPELDGSGEKAGADPYYSVFLNQDGLDARIRCACETAGNRVQQAKAGDMMRFTDRDLESLREEPCLLVRVESAWKNGDDGGVRVTGWGVVLGDNNACYDKYLLFQGEGTYALPVQEQYRPDLAENMPDQEKVGLSGYMVDLAGDALPAGRYRVGMAAMSRIGRTRLFNWSSRSVEIG